MVTIKEIAKAVGVSPSTVSIVLNGKAAERKISEKTCRAILETAGAMGYRPNIAARSLRGGLGADTLQVAVFWAQDFRAPMMVRFLAGLRQEMEKQARDIRLVVYPYNNGHLQDTQTLTNASDCHAAIICNAARVDMEFLEQTQLSIPVVLYNRVSSQYSNVTVDDARMGMLAAQAFAANGCRSALILTSISAFSGMDLRIQGFSEEAERNGMQVRQPYTCDNSMTGGYEAICQKLQTASEGEPDCIFCGSTAIALGALRALWEAGYGAERLPKIIAIGNGMEDQERYAIPSLSVVHLPMEEMAAECLRMLLEVATGQMLQPSCRMLPVTYIARETCPPAGKIDE